MLERDGELAAHVCLWPLRLQVQEATYSAFHPIDWAAKRELPGAGVKVLGSCFAGEDAAFSIGGSEMTQKILPVFGFKPHNKISFLRRPLHPWQPAWKESPRDWKLPARLTRNFLQCASKSVALDAPWSYAEVAPEDLPDGLWPRSQGSGEAVSVRSAALLRRIVECPEISRAACFMLRKEKVPLAYFFLAQVRREVRLADYGPAGLDEKASRQLGIAAQSAARRHFSDAHGILAVTAEDATADAWKKSGFRPSHTETIRVRKLNEQLRDVKRFRLTLLDWDLLCL